jgi:nucleoside phosphorylase
MLAIVSAIQDEIYTIVNELNAEKQFEENSWVSKKHDVYILPLGVGYLTAAIRLQQFYSQHPEINSVLFCGTAGSYKGSKDIGSIVQCRSTLLADAAAEVELSHYAPVLERDELQSTLKLDLDLLSGKVLTALTLTKSAETAKKMTLNTGCDFENMELYGIASVSRLLKLKWNSILGITNKVGKKGHVEWFKNHKSLETKFGNLVSEMIKSRKC